MKRLPFADREQAVAALSAAAEEVDRGGVLLLPTESFYGLGADPRRAAAVERIRAMKARPPGLDLPVLCADWEQVEALVVVPESHRVRLSRLWPAALTVVLPCRAEIAATSGATLAVRIPAHALLRALLYRVGPLTGTSANRHGDPPCTEVDGALRSLAEEPDLVLDAGPTAGGEPSTLVDLIAARPRILRPGASVWDEL